MEGASSSTHSNNSVPGANNVLSYRQRRRLASAQKNGPKRGPCRGLKALRERLKNPSVKPSANITKEMLRIVGPNAAQFIYECSQWVKHYCPLNSRNWARMDATAKQDLFDKIKAEWNLPTGAHVNRALKLQCSMLFRQWRYRLKEEHFVGKTRDEAIASRPTGVDRDKWAWLVDDYWSSPRTQRVSASNKANRQVQTIKVANGALSTARILHDMRNARAQATLLVQSEGSSNESEEQPSSSSQQEPEYIELWKKTKRHKDGSWDPDAEAKYLEFKELHAKQVELNGTDNLKVVEAFTQVLKVPRGSNYCRGLGAGLRLPRTSKGVSYLSAELQTQITEQINEFQQASANREDLLRKEIEELKSLKVEQQELLEKMKEDSLQMDRDAREREAKMKEEFMVREKKMKEDFMEMMKAGFQSIFSSRVPSS